MGPTTSHLSRPVVASKVMAVPKIAARATRCNALNKLAALSAQSAATHDNEQDIDRLCALSSGQSEPTTNGTPNGHSNTAAVPMSLRELEVLTALCKAAPLVQTTKDAEKLLRQLSPYVPEAHQQVFRTSPQHQQLPPWEALSYDLTSAVLALGLNHPSLRERAWSCVDVTLNQLAASTEKVARPRSQTENGADGEVTGQSLAVVQTSVSLLGFLNAVAQYARIWSAEQRSRLLPRTRQLLSDDFLSSLESTLSALRNSYDESLSVSMWKRWARQYAAKGRPLGAMLLREAFAKVVEESILALFALHEPLTTSTLLDRLLQRDGHIARQGMEASETVLRGLTTMISTEYRSLETDGDYLRNGSVLQQRLTRETKASCLRSYLCCIILDPEEEAASSEELMVWLNAIVSDGSQMADEALAQSVLKCMAVLARTSTPLASELTRSLPRLIVQGKITPHTAVIAGECLARVLKLLPQDLVISTLYSLGNVLSASADDEPASDVPLNGSLNGGNQSFTPQKALGSAISLPTSDDIETALVYSAVVQAIVAIAVARSEPQLTALVISMLVQKIGRVSKNVDSNIVIETAALGLCGGSNELKTLLRLYARIAIEATIEQNELLLSAVTEARVRLATWIRKDSPFFEVYLVHLLSGCVSSGDTARNRAVDSRISSKTIAQGFRPLALLVSTDAETKPKFSDNEDLLALSRDAWFTVVVHGFTLSSDAAKQYAEEMQILATYSLPLVDDNSVDMPESSIDLNPVLRRGASATQLAQQKQALIAALPQCEHDVKGLSYPDSVFLNAALLVSNMRARGGDCTAVLQYFLEDKVKATALGNCMLAVANHSVDVYLQRTLAGKEQKFAAHQVALQLATFFEGCCHRIAKVQGAAISACDRLIDQVPSALCQKVSLFALLELLTLMWKGCLDTETDEYDWKSTYSSDKGHVSIHLSDDANFRQLTLTNFHKRCRAWVTKAIAIAPLDVKGLLQAYLEDYEDDGAYGHVALGRSFALEMGSLIPSTDQRLTSLDRQRDFGVNTASDFVAQYTSRQEYRHLDGVGRPDNQWALIDHNEAEEETLQDAEDHVQADFAELRQLGRRLRNNEAVPFATVKDLLRNAAAVLSGSGPVYIPLIQDLVGIPFAIFTKQSINLGISLWLGVIKANPSVESRILVEVAAGWEASVRLRKGFFNSALKHLDPFYVKEEFAPSNWEAIKKRQQLVHNLISPHLRLTHFLASHFSATRLTSPSIERIYARLMRITLLSLEKTVTQPLAREVHFHIILLALRILKYSTHLDVAAQWRFKDAILSGALAWFATPPKWSFGSNKLQIKAEIKLLGDVTELLKSLAVIGSKPTPSLPALQQRQELLLNLISHDMGRLSVWISPLAHDAKSLFSGHHESPVRDSTFTPLLKIAWAEDPRIAIQLATRFPSSQKLAADIRALLMRNPEEAIHEPDSLYVLLGSSLPADIKTQLKYLLYWAPVNPMAAVTYFLPAYGNHPSVIQYAVRALESHSIDVTFFYVPQIVQTLRYDALGYVERYIVETALFSQLFAHQIIWNMKANSYKYDEHKDEEDQIPDPVKPVLDRVRDALVSSFADEDKDFFEREFSFFGKVTGISGTLKPLIKRPKAERKQKIEEELRKIEVDVGVYLPSNPDGVVIGIDRKSGKPLQSHAKAPYMATFRIRKEEHDLEVQVGPNGQVTARRTYEVWQSAIFKVGDDCRQDVLALQLIAAFRGIFNNVGLDVFVFPYRVTATAPGCGVIDVLPNSISRDMLGREAVNGLYEYFVSKYGNEDSIKFQEVRSNFIKSMAAYSIISYLLQFKDRHNGNIMVDESGHILHIDFGFCFDVAPGGVKFERAPFKLTPEMVAVMGGSTQSQPFRAFEELCIKAFLASRQYVEQLAHIVETMLDSGLPCFKPTSIKHFKERFVLEKSDREAAEFVRKLVHWSEGNYSTGVYDYFQLLTNGIPY